MPLLINRDHLEEAARRIASAIARQSHNDYHEPVWSDGRARLAAQQVSFEIEYFLRRQSIPVIDFAKTR